MSQESLLLQSRKINEYRILAKPRTKQLAGLTIKVLPKVYPAGADSEVMCRHMEIKPNDEVLDIGTGTGIVALSASLKGAKSVVGTDLNPAAIKNALQNKKQLGLDNISFIVADVFPENHQAFDVVTINPPYTDKDAPDETALCFWDKGHHMVITFFEGLDKYLRPSGKAYITWSDFADQDLLPALSKANGFSLRLLGSRDGLSGFSYFVYEIARFYRNDK